MMVNTTVRKAIFILLFLLVWLSLRLFVLPLLLVSKFLDGLLTLVERAELRRVEQGREWRGLATFQRISRPRPPFVIAAAATSGLLLAWLVF